MTTRKRLMISGATLATLLAMTANAWAAEPIPGSGPPSIIAILIGLFQKVFG
jgi:hypothetical protein